MTHKEAEKDYDKALKNLADNYPAMPVYPTHGEGRFDDIKRDDPLSMHYKVRLLGD